jgi:hypothetical protein
MGERMGAVDPSRARGTVGYITSPSLRAQLINELLRHDTSRALNPFCHCGSLDECERFRKGFGQAATP